jgi:hypothetical protein
MKGWKEVQPGVYVRPCEPQLVEQWLPVEGILTAITGRFMAAYKDGSNG